jgi:hypothetical protein
MKKSCDGCKALHTEGHERCEIGYKITGKVNKCFGTVIMVPSEKCPKPTTYSQLVAIQLGGMKED